MATQEAVTSITIEAGSDLSAEQFHFVDVASDGQVDLAGNGLDAIGVVLNNPGAAGQAAEVQIAGVAKVVIGVGDLIAGDRVQSDAAGEAIAATTLDFVLGRALTGGSAGELASVLLGSTHLNIA